MQELLEKAKTDKRLLCKLKVLAVEAKLYELGASLREMEIELFPESPEVQAAKTEAEEADLLFRMVGVNVSDKRICWLIRETINVHRRRKNKFDLKDASTLETKSHQLFS